MNLQDLKRVKEKAEKLELKHPILESKETFLSGMYYFILSLSSEDGHD
jgi:hypothetical protein